MDFKILHDFIDLKTNIVGPLDRDLTIYRYVSFPSLIDMICNKRLLVHKAKIWKDPYELFLFKEEYKHTHMSLYKKEYGTEEEQEREDEPQKIFDKNIDMVFAQSWTSKKESDAMWKIYSPDKKSVRIRSTIRNLCDVIRHPNSKKPNPLIPYIGKVQYADKTDIDEWINNKIKDDTNFTETIAESLFIKRKTFSHEKEVRLVKLVDLSSPDYNNDCISFDINPLEFIDEFCLDPQIESWDKNLFREILMSFGIPAQKIKKSKLYEFHPKVHTIGGTEI